MATTQPFSVAAPDAPPGTGVASSVASEASSTEPVVIEAKGLTKRFKIYKKPSDRVAEWVSLGRVVRHSTFAAVEGVSFTLRKGRCLGVVGANGAGKSTLLKMLTGVLRPTEGSFSMTGRVLSLLELSAGLDVEMSGRENVSSMALLLNFPKEFAAARMSEIESFAELGEFFDRPVRLYSSGMRARLGFAMYACFRPDIFIVDEVLSVGDVFFRQKCATRMRQLMDEGMTMLFVSHDAQAVLNLCDEAILLQNGKLVFSGSPEEAIRRHHSSLSQPAKWEKRKPNAAVVAADKARVLSKEEKAIVRFDVLGPRRDHRHGTGEARIVGCRVTNSQNQDVASIHVDGKLTFHLLIEADHRIDRPSVGIQLYDRLNNLVFASATAQLRHKLPALDPGQRMVVYLMLTFGVKEGPYTFGLSLTEPSPQGGEQAIFHDCFDLLGPIEVSTPPDGKATFFGMVRLPMGAHHALIPTAESAAPAAP